MTDSRNDIGAPYPARRIIPGQEPWLVEAIRMCADDTAIGDIRSVINIVEPMIRADEREHGAHTRQEGWLNTESHRKVVLADLRVSVSKQIGALQEMADIGERNAFTAGQMSAYTYMLHLIDGSSDGDA